MRIKIKILALTAIIAALYLTGCHSARKAVEDGVSGRSSTTKSWTTVYGTGNVIMNEPMAMSFATRITMENDQYIHLSMRFIGMEVATLYVTADSAFFVDKYHKYLFAEPLKVVLGEKHSNLTIGDLQQIVLGQKKVPETDKINIKPSVYENTPAGYVASKLLVKAETKQISVDGELEWQPSQAKWDEANRTVNFKMPTNYRRITADELKRILNRMSF